MSPKDTDAPSSTIRRINLSRKQAPCPRCGHIGRRHSLGRRRLREIGVNGPTVLEVTYSKHYCIHCRRHFSLPMDQMAPPSGRFTNRVRHTALNLFLKEGRTLESVVEIMRSKYHVRVPPTTLHDWTVAEEDRD